MHFEDRSCKEQDKEDSRFRLDNYFSQLHLLLSLELDIQRSNYLIQKKVKEIEGMNEKKRFGKRKGEKGWEDEGIPKAISEGRKHGVPRFEDEDEDVEQFGRNEVRFPKIKLIKGSLILQF